MTFTNPGLSLYQTFGIKGLHATCYRTLRECLSGNRKSVLNRTDYYRRQLYVAPNPSAQPPEIQAPSVQPADEASSRLSVAGRESRIRPLASGGRASGVDLPAICGPRQCKSLCHFQLRDVRRASGQVAGADRSAAAGDVRNSLRLDVPCPEKASAIRAQSDDAKDGLIPHVLSPEHSVGPGIPNLRGWYAGSNSRRIL